MSPQGTQPVPQKPAGVAWSAYAQVGRFALPATPASWPCPPWDADTVEAARVKKPEGSGTFGQGTMQQRTAATHGTPSLSNEKEVTISVSDLRGQPHGPPQCFAPGRAVLFTFSHPDYTVGSGITPDQPFGSWTRRTSIASPSPPVGNWPTRT